MATLTFDLWPWPSNSSEISSWSTRAPNFGLVCQTVQSWESWQTHTQTDRRDRFYTLDRWRGRELLCDSSVPVALNTLILWSYFWRMIIRRSLHALILQLVSWNYGHNKMSTTRKISKIFKKFLRISVQKWVAYNFNFLHSVTSRWSWPQYLSIASTEDHFWGPAALKWRWIAWKRVKLWVLG